MKKTVLILAGLFFVLTATAQEMVKGNGKITKEKREVTAYDKINVSGQFDVTLVAGEPGNITVEGDENIVAMVTTEVSGGTLNIGTENNRPFRLHKNGKIKVKVPFQMLTEVSLTGAGAINSKKTLRTDIKLSVDGSGCIKLKTDSENAQAIVLGSGNITLSGNAKNFKCKIIGSGNINANGLEASYVQAWVSGSGNAGVTSSKAITGRISGSGSVAFAGNPAEQDLKRSGNGEFSTY